MRESDGGRIHGNQILTQGSLTVNLNVFNQSLFNNFYKDSVRTLHSPQILTMKLHSVKNLPPAKSSPSLPTQKLLVSL